MPKRVQQLRKTGKNDKNALKKSKPNGERKEIALKPMDEEISSSEDEMYKNDADDVDSESEQEEESAEQKRKRLAKQYLASMTTTNDSDGTDSEDEEAHIGLSARLKKDRLEGLGRFFRSLSKSAENLDDENSLTIKNLGAHNDAVTCVVLSFDQKTLYTGSKDNGVFAFNMETFAKTEIRPRWSHATCDKQAKEGEILALGELYVCAF